jgi:hypothetical protein
MKRFVRLLAVLALITAVVPDAQALPGRLRAYGGIFDGNDFMLGAGYELKIPFVTIVPNAEYVFTGGSNYDKYYSLNLDGQFGFLPIPLIDIWIGGGIGTAFYKYSNSGASDVTAGIVNVFAGVGSDVIPLNPFVQFKLVFKPEDNPFVFTFGIRF